MKLLAGGSIRFSLKKQLACHPHYFQPEALKTNSDGRLDELYANGIIDIYFQDFYTNASGSTAMAKLSYSLDDFKQITENHVRMGLDKLLGIFSHLRPDPEISVLSRTSSGLETVNKGTPGLFEVLFEGVSVGCYLQENARDERSSDGNDACQ